MPNPSINIRNLNYIQNAKKGELQPHMLAEALNDISNAYGQQAVTITSLQSQLTAALARITALEKA